MLGGESKEQLTEEDMVKHRLLENLIEKGLRVSDGDLAEIFELAPEYIQSAKENVEKRRSVMSETPVTWDYVIVFDIGEDEPFNKNVSYSQKDYNGQIIMSMKDDLERARLSVKPFKTKDESMVIFCIGITESALRHWANERDTDLLVNPEEAIKEGRKKNFPLAVRTAIDQSERQEDNGKTLPKRNWKNIYVQYNPRANPDIYTHYPRITGDPNSSSTVFSEKTRLRIIYEAIVGDKVEFGAEVKISDYILSKKHPLKACFPLHNQVKLEDFEENWIRDCHPMRWMSVPLESIREYFGESVGFYFGFMIFYLKWLIVPSIIGFIFFIAQLALENVDITGIWLLSLMIIFWSVAFVDFWLQQESRYRLEWGMTKYQEKAVSRPQFTGEWKHDRVTGKWNEEVALFWKILKSTATMSGIIIFMCMCISGVIVILLFRDAKPKDLRTKVGLGVANGVMIAIFDFIYKKLSVYGNDFENHRTEQEYQDSLITKAFFFKFFNSFSSLFYLAFVRAWTQGNGFYIAVYGDVCPDCGDATDGWADCSASGIDLDDYGDNPKSSEFNDYEKCCIKISESCTQAQAQKHINQVIMKDLQIQLASLFVTAIVIQNLFEVAIPLLVEHCTKRKEEKAAEERGEVMAAKSEAELQAPLIAYESTLDDMSEIIVQFGYVTLFIIALPITPLLALINNIVELKVDAINLVKSSQRPHPNGSPGLGAWNNVLSFFALIAVGTNVALIGWRTTLLFSITGKDSTAHKWIFFSVASIVLALIVSAEKAIIPDVPLGVTRGIERQRLVESVLVQNAIVEPDEDENPENHKDEDEFIYDQNKEAFDFKVLYEVPTGRLCFLEEGTETNNNTTNTVEMEP